MKKKMLIYAMENPNEKHDVFSDLLLQCIERHVQLKRIKVTSPPAPLLEEDKALLSKKPKEVWKVIYQLCTQIPHP